MRKLLIAVGIGLTVLFNMHHAMAAPADAAAQAQAERAVHAVYDAKGKPAGLYIPSGPVVLDVGSALIAVYPERDVQDGQYDAGALKWGSNGAALFYAQQDCAGQPLINSTSGGPPGTRPVALARDSSGNFTAYIGASGRSATAAYRSWRDTMNGSCTNTWGSAVPINAWELEKTVIINQLYPEPLTVR